MAKAKLLVIEHKVVYDPDSDIRSIDTFPRFVSQLATCFNEVYYSIRGTRNICKENLTPLSDTPGINDNKLTLVETEVYRGIIDYYKKLPLILLRNLFVFKKVFNECDAVMLRIPAMNCFLAYFLCAIYKKPLIAYVVGDEREIIRSGSRYTGPLKLIALAAATIHSLFYRVIIKNACVSFFLSRSLMKDYKNKNSHFVFSSLVTNDGIIVPKRQKTKQGITNLLYAGRLAHEKGLEYLLKAGQIMLARGLKIKIIICGDGPERAKFQSLSAALGIRNNTDFLGYIPWGWKLDEIYLKSDIFVLPSVSEGVPKVILESMAKGLPVIATNVGGIPDIIEDGENGILIPPKSPEAIAEAVGLLMTNDNVRQEIIKNGYRFVKEHTAEKQAEKIASIIYEHMGTKRA